MDSLEDSFPNFKIPRVNNVINEESHYQVSSILEDSYEQPVTGNSRYAINPAAQNGVKRPKNYIPKEESEPNQTQTTTTAAATTMTYKDTFQPPIDPSLPKELTDKFLSLWCKLCETEFNSVFVAKSHYFSKNHTKKIRKFLVDFSRRTGEPIIEFVPPIKKAKLEIENEDKNFYCTACDLALTGKLHADSHYMGKNHHKVIAQGAKPSGRGHYDVDGNWVRRVASVPQVGDTFGAAFKKPDESVEIPIKAVVKPLTKTGDKPFCSICNVQVTTLDQLQAHLNGEKHRKQKDKLAILKGGLEGIAAYKTPSGSFYCNTCNISLNSELQFSQHLNSKKHVKKLTNKGE